MGWEKHNKYAEGGFGEEDMPIAEIEINKLRHGGLWGSSMGRCVAYRKIGEWIYDKKGYSELVDPDAETALRELICTVDKNKRTCVRGTSEDKGTPRALHLLGILRRMEAK